MKIGIIQASSQQSKNKIIEYCVKQAIAEQPHEIINFGVYENAQENISYIQAALCIALLLESKSIDFMVTGCSSGQGMMLACNSLPGVLCGYVQTVADAYLFGRINHGNAISYPLGLHWGWGAEINLKGVLTALFHEPFGIGYPKEEANRKQHDTQLLKEMNAMVKKDLTAVLPSIDQHIVHAALHYSAVYDYIMLHGSNEALKNSMVKLY